MSLKATLITFNAQIVLEVEFGDWSNFSAKLQLFQLGELFVILLPIAANFKRTSERLVVESVQIIWG